MFFFVNKKCWSDDQYSQCPESLLSDFLTQPSFPVIHKVGNVGIFVQLLPCNENTLEVVTSGINFNANLHFFKILGIKIGVNDSYISLSF